jgi:hypothetical protein
MLVSFEKYDQKSMIATWSTEPSMSPSQVGDFMIAQATYHEVSPI